MSQLELNPQRWRILAAVGVGTIMSPLDGSVVNIALPTITAFYHTTLGVSEWVSMAYLLVISSLLLTYGRLGDLYGHRSVYLAGFTIFTAGSLLCGLSPNIGALIAFRIVQALGAGMMMAAGPAIITDAFPPYERGKALGINGMIVGVGLALGPVLGGLLVRAFGWHAIFYINLPIGIVGTWWAMQTLPKPRGAARKSGAQGKRRFDVTGAVTLSVTLFCFLLALSRGESWGWLSPLEIILWIASIVVFVLFLRVEQQAIDPMVDLSLFRLRLFSAANASALLNFMAQFSVTFLIPFYLQQTLGMPPNEAGMTMLAMPAIMLFLAPLAGGLSDRFGSRILAPLGMIIIAVALVLLSNLNTASSSRDIFWRLALMGAGAGIFQAPNNSAIMGSVPRNRLGLASGMLATMRNIGMVLGIAISGAVFSTRYGYYLAGINRATMPEAYMLAVRDAFRVGALLAVLGVFTSLVRGKEDKPARQPLPETQL
jgi:EmrB/QacA subfamily drug resistance transporter